MQITERHITNEVRPPTVCNNIQHVNRVKSGKKLKCKTTNGKTREQIFDGKGGRKWMGAFTCCVTILLCFTEEAFKVVQLNDTCQSNDPSEGRCAVVGNVYTLTPDDANDMS